MSKIKKKRIYNESYFENIDTEIKAYYLGLLYADGCNHASCNKIELGLQEEDGDIVRKLSKLILGFDATIIARPRKKNWQNIIRINLCNKKITSDLDRHGVVKNKTFKITFPYWLDNNLYRHFIRGYLDGDGSIGERRVRFTSNCNFNSKLQEILKSELNLKLTYYTYRNVSDLSTTKLIDSYKLLSWLYENSTIHLERKYLKYLELKNKFKIKLCIKKNKIINKYGNDVAKTRKHIK